MTHFAIQEQQILIQYFKNYSIRIRLRGLKEPLDNLMKMKYPSDLNIALNMLNNDFQLDTVNSRA